MNISKKFKKRYVLKSKSKFAFSMAEVLITLVVIGVVSAATIPVLLSSTNDMELKMQKKLAYVNLSDAAKVLSTDGKQYTNPYTDPILFLQALAGKMNTVCTNCTFGSGYITATRFTDNNGAADPGSNFNFKLINGTIIYNLIDNNGTSDFRAIIVDVNGEKKPNTFCKDIFILGFNMAKYSITPDSAIIDINGGSADMIDTATGLNSCAIDYLF